MRLKNPQTLFVICGALFVGMGAALSGCASSSHSTVLASQTPQPQQPIVQSTATPPETPHLLNAAELEQFIRGRAVNFTGSSTAYYYTNKNYKYRPTGARKIWHGIWYIKGDKVCVDFTNGDMRCDSYGYDGQSYYLLTAKQQKYGVASVTAISS